MTGWLAQLEPILESNTSNYFVLLGVLLASLFIVTLVLLILRLRRSRQPKPTTVAELQARLQDVAVSEPPAKAKTAAPAGLSPIEEKLRQLEAAEREAESPPLPTPAGQTFEPAPLSSYHFASSDPTEVSHEDILQSEIDFELETELPFLFDDAPTPPAPLLTVLRDIDARTYVAQVNQFALKGQGKIHEAANKLELTWRSPAGEHLITLQAINQETLLINNREYAATADGIKQGLVATLREKNY